MFSPPVYLSVGDEYDKRPLGSTKSSSQSGAKPFVVSAKRHPHVTEATFSPFASLSTGDPYRTAGFEGPFRKSEPAAAAAAAAPPFRPAGASHKSSGKGDYYGTFSESNPPKHEPELPPLKESGKAKEGSRRNFVTNRPKKGTYGYTGLTIARAGEVQYIADPYQGTQQREALEQKKASAQQMGPPFRAAVRRTECFDETEHGYPKVYSLTKPLPPKKPQKQSADGIAADKPWVPGGALVSDITKFPEYTEDPYDVKERKIREIRQKESSYKAWVPAGTDPYRHIYTKPVNYDPPEVR